MALNRQGAARESGPFCVRALVLATTGWYLDRADLCLAAGSISAKLLYFFLSFFLLSWPLFFCLSFFALSFLPPLSPMSFSLVSSSQ